MGYWNGSQWTDDPARAAIDRSATARTGQRRFFDWVITAIMLLALPFAGVVARERAAADVGAASLMAADVYLLSDGSTSIGTDEATTTQWAGYRWRGRAPIVVSIRSFLQTPAFVSALQTAAATWSDSSVVDVSFEGGGKRGIDVYEGDYGAGQPAAWTQVYKRNGYISSVSIFVNTYHLGTASGWMLQFALCHELGHGLGLAHQLNSSEPGCLNPMLPATVPNSIDYTQLELIY
jgi:hypothetical protein